MASSKRTYHFHGCTRCRTRYADGCLTPNVDGLCFPCETGRPGWQLLLDNQSPKDCCRQFSRIMRTSKIDNELAAYRLSNCRPWWICLTCQRTFAFSPLTRQEEPA